MEEQFKYGEEVMVRDHDTEEWQKRHYLMTAPEGKFRYFTVYPETRLDGFRIAQFAVYPFAQIRKIQPEHDLIEIEQPESIEERFEKIEAILNGAIAHMNEQIASIKKSLK